MSDITKKTVVKEIKAEKNTIMDEMEATNYEPEGLVENRITALATLRRISRRLGLLELMKIIYGDQQELRQKIMDRGETIEVTNDDNQD